MYHPLPRSFLYSAYMLRAGFENNQGSRKGVQGTGFFVGDHNNVFLVTNRHNVDLSFKDQKYLGFRLSGLEILGYFGEDRFVRSVIPLSEIVQVCFAKDFGEDLAVIKIGKVYVVDSPAPVALSPFKVDLSMIANEMEFKNALDICDLLAFPGYPPWFDRNGYRPIVRMGSIASDPSSDYRPSDIAPHARLLTYEAFSFGGSSGSPVFALPRGIKVSGGLTGGNFRSVMLVGVNCGHLADGVDFPTQHSGISYLVKSVAISDCLETLMQ